ncbi:MAG: hypothetical protein J6334_04205 [Kiritimatiellae bacterium]|nr:hypothetical protein [Kiritimatiellia bacterium]
MRVVQPLLDLQEIDSRIREFEQELKDIPLRIAQEKKRLDGALNLLATAQADLKTAQMRVDDLAAEVQTRKDKVQKLKQEQSELKSNNDYKMFSLQINTLENEISKLEGQQLIAMDNTIPAKRRVADAEAKLSSEQAVIDDYVREMEDRQRSVQAEMAAAEQERQAYLPNVPDMLLRQYGLLSKKRWPVVVSLRRDGDRFICNGCHLVQPPSVGQMAVRNEDVVHCEMCGRILYV